jgi:hypothetical protein
VSIVQRDAFGVSAVLRTVPVTPGLFQGGYLDFMAHGLQMTARAGPPRTSMLDDLCFYIQNYSSLISTSELDSVGFIARKIVSSQYLLQTLYLSAKVGNMQFHMTRRNQALLDYFTPEFVEAQWSDSQVLERRLSEYLGQVESIMMQLRIPLELPDPTRVQSWMDTTADFQFVYMRLKDIRHRAESLNAATAGLAGMSGNRQALREQERSLREAKSTRALTFLGLIFIPLAYVASLFSMADPYGPGGGSFWVYFAISLPLIVVVVVAYYMIDMGYNVVSSTGGFSLQALFRAIRVRLSAGAKGPEFQSSLPRS